MQSDHTAAGQGDGDVAPPARLVADNAGRDRAQKLFSHAKKAEESRNYDYAIELYVQGLALWPDALDEGLKKLRVVATARKQMGGKPPGFMTRRKYPTNSKDAAANLNNVLHIFGLNPADILTMEHILQLAQAANCDVVGQWIAPVLADAYNNAKKLPANHYHTAADAMDVLSHLAVRFDNAEGAMEIRRAEQSTAQIWSRHYPDSPDTGRVLGRATSNLTIIKGKFDKAEGFVESLRDADQQREIHDRDRRTHTADRMQHLIQNARRDWEANRNVPNKLLNLVDLLTRTGNDATENEAVSLLEAEYAQSSNFVFKQKADELRVRQFSRRTRELADAAAAHPDDAEIKQRYLSQRQAQLEFETGMYEARQRQYPTDLKTKYRLGQRYFLAGRVDDSIPLFQVAAADPRIRSEALLALGRCFFEKRFFDQSVETLRRGVDETDSRTSPVAMELNYWLGRSLEESRDAGSAKKVYGSLIQIDYNYKDARQRLETLVQRGDS
jgi:tetratricopeptide (TPR) repeat protein